jgi:hypothetical protein
LPSLIRPRSGLQQFLEIIPAGDAFVSQVINLADK